MVKQNRKLRSTENNKPKKVCSSEFDYYGGKLVDKKKKSLTSIIECLRIKLFCSRNENASDIFLRYIFKDDINFTLKNTVENS